MRTRGGYVAVFVILQEEAKSFSSSIDYNTPPTDDVVCSHYSSVPYPESS